LERLNGSPGRYADTEAALDRLAISVDGFCVTDRAAGARALVEADERFQGRTVTWRPPLICPKARWTGSSSIRSWHNPAGRNSQAGRASEK